MSVRWSTTGGGGSLRRRVLLCPRQPQLGPVHTVPNPPEYKDPDIENIATLAMIETQEALDNLDDILSTPGLDAIYVGPSDLAISLGESPDAMAGAPKVQAAIQQILEKAQQHDVIPAIHTGSGEMAKEYLAKGWRLTTIQNDMRLMLAGAASTGGGARLTDVFEIRIVRRFARA